MTRSVTIDQFVAGSVVCCVALALLIGALPLPPAWRYSLSFTVGYIGLGGILFGNAGAIFSLAVHCYARIARLANAPEWLALAKRFQPMLLAALGLVLVATEARPALEAEVLFRLQLGPHVVQLSGATPADMDERLSRALPPDARIERVELSGIGGSVEAAERTAALLQAHGVTTAVAVGECASACAVMFERFPHRYVAPEGELGFHAFRGGGPLGAISAEQQEIGYLASRGISRTYLNALFAHDELSWPDRTELQKQHLIDGCWNVGTDAPVTCEEQLASR